VGEDDQRNRMKWVLFIVFLTLFVVISVSTIWLVFYSGKGPSESDRSLVVKIFIGEVGAAVVALFYAVFNLRSPDVESPATEAQQVENGFFVKSYPRSQHPEFFAEVEKLLPTARKITLIAVGLNLVWEKHILDLLMERAVSGSAEIIICMGNTESPHVEDRLIEEEMGANRPSVGRSGVGRNTRSIVERVELAGRPRGMQVLLFEHYLTFATLLFDDDIFIYPYGYQILGNASPIFHLKDDGGPEAKFLLENASRIVRDAVPARDVIAVKRNRRYTSDQWLAAAVYVIPDRDSEFYKLGSSVLGFDIHANHEVTPESGLAHLAQYVGEAKSYGFHATLADALQFSTASQIERVRAEVKFLSEDFAPFRLQDLRVEQSPQDPRAVIIEAQDRSGTAEAIHHELVSRVYRSSISSSYLSGQTRKALPKDDPRADLLLQRYGSPYILSALRMHFTLLAAAPTDNAELAEIVDLIQREFDGLSTGYVEVNDLALMVKRPGEDKWRIEETFPLCGPRWS
jgi:hypothetical protein